MTCGPWTRLASARTTSADPLARLLAGGRVVVIDGGLATELEAEGHHLGDELWSARLLADEPEAIVAAHLAYFRVGARIAITASYQATFEGFAARGLDREAAAALLRRSVTLAAEARERYRAEVAPVDPGPLLVAASVGPYGAWLADGAEYRGALRPGLGVPSATSTASGSRCSGAPAPIFSPARRSRTSSRSGRSPTWWTRPRPAAGLRSPAPTAATSVTEPRWRRPSAIADATRGFVAVGVNCTAPEHVEELVARIAGVTAKPVVVYPNSGEGWEAGTGRWLPASGPDVDVATARRWVAAGARLVGGCCRVGPGRIGELAAAFGG